MAKATKGKAPKKVKMDRKVLAYRTKPHENEYYAKKFGVSMEVFRDIVENVNNSGKPARSLARIEAACGAYLDQQKQEPQTPIPNTDPETVPAVEPDSTLPA